MLYKSNEYYEVFVRYFLIPCKYTNLTDLSFLDHFHLPMALTTDHPNIVPGQLSSLPVTLPQECRQPYLRLCNLVCVHAVTNCCYFSLVAFLSPPHILFFANLSISHNLLSLHYCNAVFLYLVHQLVGRYKEHTYTCISS